MKAAKRCFLLAVLVAFLSACASPPPQAPSIPQMYIKDFGEIVGEYKGKFDTGRIGSTGPIILSVVIIIHKDGSYVANSGRGPRKGKLEIMGGKVQGVNRDGVKFTGTFYEGEGKRIYITESEDGGRGRYTFVQ